MVARAIAIVSGLPNANFAVCNQTAVTVTLHGSIKGSDSNSPIVLMRSRRGESDTVGLILCFLSVVNLTRVIFHPMNVPPS